MAYNLSVYTCPKCGAKSNGILCISCLDKDIQRDRQVAQRRADAPLRPRKPQEFDTSAMPLFGDQSKQENLF